MPNLSSDSPSRQGLRLPVYLIKLSFLLSALWSALKDNQSPSSQGRGDKNLHATAKHLQGVVMYVRSACFRGQYQYSTGPPA